MRDSDARFAKGSRLFAKGSRSNANLGDVLSRHNGGKAWCYGTAQWDTLGGRLVQRGLALKVVARPEWFF